MAAYTICRWANAITFEREIRLGTETQPRSARVVTAASYISIHRLLKENTQRSKFSKKILHVHMD